MMDRKIAIIGGTGDQGMGLALRLAMAGEDVVIGSRDARRAQNTVDKIKKMTDAPGLKLEGMSNEDAASLADIIILTVPLHAQMATLKSIKEHVKGKILIDATVPLESSLGGSGAKYLDLWDGSAAERSAKFLEDVVVVSAFNNISAYSLLNFKEDVDCDCLITSDDEEAKKIVIELAEKIPGVRGIDCGSLENARIIEKITPLLINLNMKNKIKNAGIRITKI
ncbi:MAG: NADPH-dependent F420 reductase [Methanobacteriaceae archaeon]|nr:NADPH-dependent F420 reductase [Methanobacteriaceae archaeon]